MGHVFRMGEEFTIFREIKGRRHLEEQDVDGMIIFKWILNK
jgi:hypothetical protein